MTKRNMTLDDWVIITFLITSTVLGSAALLGIIPKWREPGCGGKC